MDLTQLANLGEFIGGVAVLVTLVYLAAQVRSSNRTIRAEAQSGSIESFAASNMELLRNGPAQEMLLKIVHGAPYEELTEREQIQALLYFRTIIQRFEAGYHKWREGLFDAEYWSRARRGMGEFLSPPALRHLLALDSDQYTPSFHREMTSALEEHGKSSGGAWMRTPSH